VTGADATVFVIDDDARVRDDSRTSSGRLASASDDFA
jgi:hypothetical protein